MTRVGERSISPNVVYFRVKRLYKSSFVHFDSASYGEVTGEGVETEEIDEYSQDPHSKAVPVGVTERLRQFFQPRRFVLLGTVTSLLFHFLLLHRETQDNEEAQASSSNANVQESNIVDETMEIVRSQPEFAEL